jgi:predicted aminopeptidase
MMDFIKSTWLLVAFACLMLLIMSSCVRIGYYNDSGEMDAEITIRPSDEAIQNTIESGEIDQGIEAQVVIPISRTD